MREAEAFEAAAEVRVAPVWRRAAKRCSPCQAWTRRRSPRRPRRRRHPTTPGKPSLGRRHRRPAHGALLCAAGAAPQRRRRPLAAVQRSETDVRKYYLLQLAATTPLDPSRRPSRGRVPPSSRSNAGGTPMASAPPCRSSGGWVREILGLLYIVHNRRLLGTLDCFRRAS
jgi:hypothetical protein